MSGYSQATVSRVFTAPHLVSPITRSKVEAAADRLGYVPNAIARSLRSQRTNIIGAVVPAGGEYWQHALTTFSRRLAASGQQLLLFSFQDEADLMNALRSVEQYRLDGVILASATISTEHMPRLVSREFPVLAFNQPAASGIVPSVSVDNHAGSAALAEHLVGCGCRSVVFVGGDAKASTDEARHRGAAETLAAAGGSCSYVEAGAFTYAAGHRAAIAITALDDLPDAVMVSSDELAFGVVDGLAAAGVRIPRRSPADRFRRVGPGPLDGLRPDHARATVRGAGGAGDRPAPRRHQHHR